MKSNILRVWHWEPLNWPDGHEHVLGGYAHVPPFRHGGLQTAKENTYHSVTFHVFCHRLEIHFIIHY